MGQIDAVDEREKRISQLIAPVINFTLLRFLISQRVPGASPLRFTDMLISQRRDPYVEKNMIMMIIIIGRKDDVAYLFHVSIT